MISEHFENLLKLQCFGSCGCGSYNGGCGSYNGGCGNYGSCGCQQPCVVYKTVTQVVSPTPTPTPTPTPETDLAYGYVYNEGAQTVAASAPVAFSANGPLEGITHAVGGTSVTLTEAGTYAVRFSVTGTTSNQFGLFLNGTAIPGSIYGSTVAAATTLPTTTGAVIFTAPAGSTLQLINNTGSPVTLGTQTGGTATNVNASMLITQLA